jgi:hypothetical protein
MGIGINLGKLPKMGLPIAKAMVVLIVLLLTSMLAWSQESTGSLVGKVTDPSGAVVPGVNITITNNTTHRALTTTTGADGTYRAQDLEPGRYSVTFEMSGFAKHVAPDVLVLLGRTLKVDAQLSLGSTSQVVTVTGAAVAIDTTSTMVAQNITSQEFDLLPKPRNFEGLAILSTSVNTGEIEGGYQINGSSSAENNYYIDGVSTTSVIDGSARQAAVFDHLQEVQVKTGGIEAEYGGALGGVVSAVTKSGGNSFHGDIHFYYYGNGISAGPTERMQIEPVARAEFTYFQDQKNQNNNYEFGGSLGGPIMKDKLFFFTSITPRWRRATYDYQFSDGPGSMSREALYQSWFSKLTFDPTNRISTNFTWLYTPTRLTGQLFTYDDYCANCSVNTIANAADVREKGFSQPEQSYSGSIDITLSSRSILSAKGGRYYLDYKDVGVPASVQYYWRSSAVDIPGLPADLQQPSGFFTPSAQQTSFDITTRTYGQMSFSQVLTNALGQHNFKIGVGVQKNVNKVFDSLAADGRVNLYWGLPGPNGETGTYGYYSVDEYGTIGSAGASIVHLYAQDSWQIHPRLTLNIGLRTERETVPSFARSVKDYAFRFGFSDKLAPRLGASFDVFGTGKLKISGAWGRFYDWTKYDLARGTFGGDIWRVYYRTLDTTDIYSINLSNLPGNNVWTAPTFRNRRVPGFEYLDPNIKPMSSDIFNVGVEYELQPQTVFSARYTRNKLNRTIEDMGVLDAQGNEVYRYGNPGEGTNVVEPASGASCPIEVGGACAVPMPKAERKYDAMELQLQRRFSNRWMGAINYVYSRLYGNYSGLQSTDEIRPTTLGYGFGGNQAFGAQDYRPGGNANRYFDLDEAFYDAHGNNGLYGDLPTDRPHVLKIYGGYTFKFGTEIGGFFNVMSGTPITTQVNTINQIPMYVEGRGDLGRTPTISRTDLMVAHEFRFGEVRKLRFEINMMNLFNQKTTEFIFDRYNQEELADSIGMDLSNVDLTKGFDWRTLAAEASAAGDVPLDPRYKKDSIFASGFGGRFSVNFIF